MKGIYKITNILDGKYYVGSSIEVEKRWDRHREALRRGGHKNDKLQNAWTYWGEHTFIFEHIEDLHDKTEEQIRAREDVYLAICKEHPDTNYNCCYDSRGGSLSDYTIEKIKRKCAAVPRTEEWRRKIGEANRRRKVTVETRAKISKSLMGHVYPQKTEATREKLRLAITGLKRGPMSHDHREKLRIASTGKKHSPETIAKMRRPKSEETKRRMSEGAKRRWANVSR